MYVNYIHDNDRIYTLILIQLRKDKVFTILKALETVADLAT